MLFFKILFKEIYYLLKDSAQRRFLYFAFRYGNHPRYQAKNISLEGKKWRVPDLLSFIWQYKEIFGDESYRFKSPQNSPIIIDCGANIGTSILYFKKLYPQAKIIAIEADAHIAEYLESNIRTFGWSDIQIHKKAAWIHEEGLALASDGSDMASFALPGDKTQVPSLRLKSLLQEYPQIDMLKMDIEGAEIPVIQDCGKDLARVQNLFIEFHAYTEESQNLSSLLKVLEENNFRYYITNPHSRVSPLIQRLPRQRPAYMDLQLNIHAYQSAEGKVEELL